MYAETSEKKMTRARIGFALLCGLAVCCSVMYITADAGDEYMHEVIKGKDAGTSVASTDVLKAGVIYTETPDGRMRLMDYFNRVEKSIASEVATRKADIASVRAEMQRDFRFNARARYKLHKAMLKQMARNAKIAKDNLNRAMRRTQEKFAKQASLANRRQRATNARNRKTLAIAAADRRENAKNLRLAVSAWQKQTAAWAAATNAKIDRANRHVAANAAAITENAKKATKDLNNAMNSWNHKIARFSAGEKAANSKLGRQFKAQDKATRAWATNKINAMVASTGAQFAKVETKMAKNRHEVDMALRQATMRFAASLNAQKALEDRRYAQTVRNIQAARAEAKAKVSKATTEFKMGLLNLGTTVRRQVTKVNNRIDAAASVVRKNRAAQAKVNANIAAETRRMIKLGNKRYRAHLKHDAELQRLINKRQAETTRKLNKMSDSFNAKLQQIRKTLARDRKHAESRLTKETAKVWAAFSAQRALQAKKNAALEAATRRMKLDAWRNIRLAKASFRRKIHNLGRVVAKNDRAAEKKIAKLTGVVKRNAEKSAAGRKQIAILEQANKNELRTSIRKAIATGEKRAQLVEKRGKQMDKDTQWLINNNLKEKIAKLQRETNASVDQLAAEGKRARAALRRQMIYAVKSMAKVAKDDLALAMKDSVKTMNAFQKKASAAHKKSAADRARIAGTIKANAKDISRRIRDAVLFDARSQNALREETQKKIKNVHNRLDIFSLRMRQIAKANRAAVKAQMKATLTAISNEQRRARIALGKFSSADSKRQAASLAFLKKQLKKAAKEADDKFGKAYKQLAKDKAKFDRALGGATKKLNQALAKQAALADGRFSKTVKDLAAARKQATAQVKQLRQDFSVGLVAVTAESKRVNTRITGQISVVSGEVQTLKSNQITVNNRVKRELAEIRRVSNVRFSEAKRARGRLKALMDENKKAAAAEVKALEKGLNVKIAKLRARNARNSAQMASDLKSATKKLYGKMADMQKYNAKTAKKLNAATTAAATASRNALKRAQKGFATKMAMLTSVIAANAKRAQRATQKLTGVASNINKANKAARKNIRAQTSAMQADMNKRIVSAITTGEALGKAIQQRLSSNLKSTVRSMRVELAEGLDRAADRVLRTVSGKRHKMADNYLSLKAYSVAAVDKVIDYTAKGKGRNLSSIGDLVQTIGALGAAHAVKAQGLGMGGNKIRSVFSAKTIKVSNSLAAVNGLVNEYAGSCKLVRARWPMGLGKYLMDKLEVSMLSKGVLQVDKISGKKGNYVYINGRSVGLSNKLNDFASLAAKMSVYEAVLAKLTAKLPTTTKGQKVLKVLPPQWQGN